MEDMRPRRCLVGRLMTALLQVVSGKLGASTILAGSSLGAEMRGWRDQQHVTLGAYWA